MKDLGVRASRSTGAELVAELVRREHLVTAYARQAAADADLCITSPPTFLTRTPSARR